MKPRTPFVLSLVLLALAQVAAAQLDVPDTGARAPAPGKGVEVPRKPRGDLAPKKAGEAETPAGPDFGKAGPGEPEAAPPAEPGPEPELAAEPASLPPPVGAGSLLDSLREVDQPSDPRISAALDELIAAGPAGLSTGRAALYGDSTGLVLVGAELLLKSGTAADRALVAARLERRMPQRAIQPCIELFVRYDPVGATPERLASLLDHPQGAVRDAAAKELARQAGSSEVPLLAARLRSERSDTRIATLDVLAGVDDPAATNLVLDRLDDPVAKVAARASRILAEDEAAEPLLLAAAFPERFDRRAGYARLALVEREDRKSVGLVDESHVPGLLTDLVHEDPLRRGSAALLLAGIGFRGEGSRGFEWLDRAVPHELVRQISGDSFHKDLSSIVEPAQRRLGLLTGQTFGSDGEGWQRWWIAAAATFRSHRAVVDVAPGEEVSLEVLYKGAAPEHTILRFLGPAAPPDDPAAPVLGRTILLSAAGASDLAERLREEGVFSAQRLPSPTLPFTPAVRELEVKVNEQEKRFLFPAVSMGEQDLWFERLVHTLERMEEQNRWQRFPAGAEPAAFFAAESEWWAVPRTPEERDQRLKTLVEADLAHLLPFERGPGIEELEALAGRGALGPADYPAVVSLLRDERYYGERVPRLVDLARTAVRDGATGRLPTEVARDLVELLAASFPAEAAPDVVRVLEESDPELTRASALDERPILRALAAAGLARSGTPEDLELLQKLFSDPSPDVEAAAILACAENGRHGMDVDLLYRARVAEPRVRQAALRAIGRLKLEGARDALVTSMADPSQAIQIASAEGLADLCDPESAPLLVSILARGSRSPMFEAAQRGLRALGSHAHDALLRSASSIGAGAREATLLLSEDLVPEAAPILIRMLVETPDDARIASELAILTCVDCRENSEPAVAWSQWYQTVVKDDARAWFRAACERAGMHTPPAEEFAGGGTPAARAFLVAVLGRPENHLVERARRELGQLLGADLGTLPSRGPLRETWLSDLSERIGTPGAAGAR